MSVKSIVLKAVFGIVCICCMAGIVFSLLPEDEKIKNGDNIAVNNLDEQNIIKIDISGENGYTFIKSGSGWAMEGMEGIDVTDAYVDALVKSMCNITSPMAVGKELDLENYGLEVPKYTVTMWDGDEHKVYIGDMSGKYRFLKTDESDEVYIVSEEDLYMVFMDRIKYLESKIFDIDLSKVIGISLGGVKAEKNEEGWQLTSPYNCRGDGDKIENAIADMENLKVTDIVKFENMKNGERAELIFDGSKEIFEVYCMDDEYCYIRKENGEYLYKTEKSGCALLEQKPFDFVNKYIAPIAVANVMKIEFMSPMGENVVDIEAPSSEAPVFYINRNEALETSFRAFYAKLASLTFTKEGKSENSGIYKIKFTLENGGEYEIEFCGYDGSDSELAVIINGEGYFLVNRKAVEDVFKAIKDIEIVK